MRSILTAIALTLIISAAGCKGHEGPKAVKQDAIKGVKTARVAPSKIMEYHEVSGTVQAHQTSVISSRVMGAVTAVHVKEGDRVHKGQALISIDDRDSSERIKQSQEALSEAQSMLRMAERRHHLAETTFQRYKALYEAKALSRQEFDNVSADYELAKEELERVRASLRRTDSMANEARIFQGYAKIVSPINGVVVAKSIEAGSMAAPGMPLLTIEDTSTYELIADMDEKMINRIAIGQAVPVSIDSLSSEIEGKVIEIVPTINSASRTFTVKVAVRTQGIRSGLYGKARFATGMKEALTVPIGSVVRKGELEGVYIADDKGMLVYRLIKTGRMADKSVEVLSGLNAGDNIVTEGVELAIDGGQIIQGVSGQ